MIYPLYLVNIDQPGTFDLMRRSYDAVRGETGADGDLRSGSLTQSCGNNITHQHFLNCF